MGKRLKGLLFILDGLGDVPIPELNGKTPLESAELLQINKFARDGVCGLVDPLAPGITVDTHTGVAMLIGVPDSGFKLLKRGPIEAAGAGLQLDPQDVVMRCNFATINRFSNGYRIIDRRAGRLSAKSVKELCLELEEIRLDSGITGSIHPATQHRAILRLRGANLSDNITDSDPGGDGDMTVQPVVPANPDDKMAIRTADSVNRITDIVYQRLKDHPFNSKRKKQELPLATGIICRGAGRITPIPTRLDRYGLRGCLIGGDCTVLGLAAYLGYDHITYPSFTALDDTDIEGKIKEALGALAYYDIAFIHIKAPDICSHDFLPVKKKMFFERFDKALQQFDFSEIVIAISGDHSTSSVSGSHSCEPVPSLLAGGDLEGDDCAVFNESCCRSGSLGRLTANEFFIQILRAMGCQSTIS